MKDYTKLKEKLTKESQITTKDIVELGFSQYDIKQLIANNILTKVSRGLYYYRPTLIEEPEQVNTIEEQIKEEQPSITPEQISMMSKRATTLMSKKEVDKAITIFEEIINIEPKNQYARLSIFACYMFKKDFETSYNKLIELYNNRENDELLLNVYNYMLLLKELVTIDQMILNDIANIIGTNTSGIKQPKQNSYFHKLVRAIRTEDWENALKYSSIIVNIDKNQKKYRITNQCYRFLIIAVINDKNLVFERPQQEPLPKVEYETVPTIIVPETNVETTIKQNILLEAINNNDYQTALSILEQEQIDNPKLVIKTLLTKLHSIQSLLTIGTPLKVTSTEEVRLVDENQLVLPGFEPNEEPISEKQIVVEQPKIEDTKISEQKEENLSDIAYKAYKEFIKVQNFQEARRNLQRYEYINNQQGTHRNINYHYKRLDMLENEYSINPERYFKKQDLYTRIFQAKRNKSYNEALTLIEEYKNLGGQIHPSIQALEVEIYILLNNLVQAEQIISKIQDNEEPAYYIAASHILYEKRQFEDCILMCIAYNERRPSSSAANYVMLHNCYKRLQKPGKALKALRKAEEINKSKNYMKDLSAEMQALEAQSAFQKEQRNALSYKRK